MNLRGDLLGFVPTVAPMAHSDLPALRNTAVLSSRVIDEKIPGDFVECGVFAGVHCAIMGKAVLWSWQARRVHLFDSFEGIPHAGPRDAEWPGIGMRPGVVKSGRLETTGVSACSRQQVEAYMRQWDVPATLLEYHEGWFQTVLPELYYKHGLQTVRRLGSAAPSSIALLRLDADLYESTKVCLEYLYPLLSRGGFCIIDDYMLAGCRAACDEYFKDSAHPEVYSAHGQGAHWWQK